MGGGNKKNKRGSIIIPSQSFAASPKTELIERTLENDYGVMSDPDESTPDRPLSNQNAEAAEAAEAAKATLEEQHVCQPPKENISLEDSHIQCELSSSSNSRQHSSPSLLPSLLPSPQDQSPSLQPQISQTPTLQSIDELKLKLSIDKKITLHTFFSYIILAMDIERERSVSIAHISPNNVQELIEYMIEQHAETPAVRTYLHTLVDTGVIKNLIESIIEFNKDQTEEFNKLLTTEQIELELASIQEGTRTAEVSAASTAAAAGAAASATEPPQESLVTRIRNFIKRCGSYCLCCRRRPRRSTATATATATATVTADATATASINEVKDPEMTLA
jgi:hypothetical protein